MAVVVDYSFARPDPSALRRAGVVGVVRYITGAGKRIDAAEYVRLRAAGLAVALVFEVGTTSWRPGYGTGAQHGQQARAAARSLGHPDDRPIYAAYDTSIAVGGADWNAAIAYQQGFNVGAGGQPQGAYAEAALLDELLRRGLIRFGWQTESRAFPGNATDDPRACLIQRFGAALDGVTGVDVNDVYATDYGQAPAPNSNTTTKGPPNMFLVHSTHGAGYLVLDGGAIELNGNAEYVALRDVVHVPEPHPMLSDATIAKLTAAK